MKLSSLLQAEFIRSNCQAESIESLFKEIIDRLPTHASLKDSDSIYTKLMEREKLGVTTIGEWAAIPHAKISGLKETVVFLGMSEKGIDFCLNNTGKIVHLIILILSPSNNPVLHLQTLAAAASFVKNRPDFHRENIGKNGEDILKDIELKELEYDK